MLIKRGKILSLIVAMDKNGLIGIGNKLPWHIKGDLAYFKKMTMGKDVIVGRNTYQSLVEYTEGMLLPGRSLIVVSRSASRVKIRGVTIMRTMQSALDFARCNNEVFVAGGAQIYEQTIPYADRLYVTHVDVDVRQRGACFFPQIDRNWNAVLTTLGNRGPKDPPFKHVVYEPDLTV